MNSSDCSEMAFRLCRKHITYGKLNATALAEEIYQHHNQRYWTQLMKELNDAMNHYGYGMKTCILEFSLVNIVRDGDHFDFHYAGPGAAFYVASNTHWQVL